MEFLTKNVPVKQGLLFVMLLLSGYATGAIAAKLATALGL